MSKRKKPRGRPPLTDRERRDYIVHLRLNKAEHAELGRMAKGEGRSMSNLVRVKVFGQ